MAYQEIDIGVNLSQVVASNDVQNEAMRSFERSALASAPTIKPNGLLWHQTDFSVIGDAFVMWDAGSSTWLLQWDPQFPQINAGGSVAFAADQAMAAHKLTGLSAGSAAGHSVRYQQVLKVDESTGALLANLAAGGHKITGLAAATANGDAVRYEDRNPLDSGLFRHIAAFAHQTGASPTTTYQQVSGGPAGTFAPRMIVCRVSGSNTYNEDGSVADGPGGGSYAAEFTVAWFDSESATMRAGTFTKGSVTWSLWLERKTGTPSGVFCRLRLGAADTGSYYKVEVGELMCFGGVGHGGGG